jgi:hypothetical protein
MGKPRSGARRRSGAAKREKSNQTSAAADYSVTDILDRAESCLDECQLELAQKFCQRALEMDNDNLRALQLRNATSHVLYFIGYSKLRLPPCWHVGS